MNGHLRIPTGWTKSELGILLAERKSKVTPRPGDHRPYVALEHMVTDSMRLTAHDIACSATSAKTVFQRGDLLFGKLRPNLRKCVMAPFDGVCSTDILALHAKNGATPEFVLNLLHSHRVMAYAKRTAIGTKMPRTSWEQLSECAVLVPPRSEQEGIAKALGTFDVSIDATRRVIEQTRRLKTAVLRDLLTRGLPGRHSEFREIKGLGQVPQAWKPTRLKRLTTKITDGIHASVRTVDQGVPFLYVSCVRDDRVLWDNAGRITETTYIEISRGREPVAGGVLYTAVGSYGHAAVLDSDRPFSFQRHIAYLVPNAAKLNSHFLAMWLNSEPGRRQADRVALGNAQKTITLGELNAWEIPLPSLDEQEGIVDIAQSIDERITAESKHLRSLGQVKAALSHVLLTGRVRVAAVNNITNSAAVAAGASHG